MSRKLEIVLKRNKTTLKKFILKNRLTSYESLLEYCGSKNLIPCTQEEFNINKNHVNKEEKEKPNRKTSQAQKPKRRYRRKKQQSASELPDSTDNG